ncbi:MAG: DUF255 domain-containing protein [Bacteroidales bacterium]|nr:DUF255 domain-containing protein [Bacteroidales bacterium]
MLKKWLFIAAITTSSVLFAQEKIQWHTLAEAIELNRSEPRKFMVDVYTDWCGWCKRMDADTFSDQDIAAYVNKYYYAVKFDAEMKESLTLGNKTYHFVDQGRRGYHEVAAILTKGRLSYPTIVYLDEELRHIEVEPGYKTPEQLTERLVYYKEERYKTQNPMGM